MGSDGSIWLPLLIAVSLVLTGLSLGAVLLLRRRHGRMVGQVERRLDDLQWERSATTTEIDLSPELKERLPKQVLDQLSDDPGTPTGEFTQRIESLVDKSTAELVEYQVIAKRAVVFLRSKLDQPMTVADLAGTVHVSTRTLQRALHEVLGCTPTRALLAVKMHAAKCMLKSGTRRVSEVAYSVGFENPDHFSRRFKTYYGVPPSEMLPDRP